MLSTIERWLICLTTSLVIAFDSFLPTVASSNSVRLNVYFEPQDPESTKLLKNELLPLFQDADLSERINLKLIPFGRSTCNPDHQEYVCSCPNGDEECALMHLLACTLHDYRHHEDALELISCIQGLPSIDEANHKCIRKLPESEARWLKRCPNEFRGKYLSWINGLRTKALSTNLTDVPFVTLNSKHRLEPVGLRQQLCKHLDGPKPKNC